MSSFETLIREAHRHGNEVHVPVGSRFLGVIGADFDGGNVVGFTCRLFDEDGARCFQGQGLGREESFRQAWNEYLDSLLLPEQGSSLVERISPYAVV